MKRLFTIFLILACSIFCVSGSYAPEKPKAQKKQIHKKVPKVESWPEGWGYGEIG